MLTFFQFNYICCSVRSPTITYAIAPLQLPKSDRTHELPKSSFLLTQRRRERRGSHPLNLPKAIAPLNSPNSDRTLQLPKQRSHPSTSQTAIPTERFAIASPQPPKQRFLRSASLSHPLNSPNRKAIR
ncbi:hypothetical protein [Anabaena sp. UHCC 0451]|uniref:hypothetical protein n=1 Tax=Anabaena sp. UHCC 0451 TaxID=2055235 RepID=UPI002B1EC0FF|nr:hypothetical protein [Anabaena sp. UHCC 0451]MEA5577113.1 hypothetical protein [Anabaena sp. UHCC 0451]